jgi:ribosome recycling factor
MDTILKELEAKLKSLLSRYEEELKGVRTNRPSVGLLEDIKIEYYGQVMPLKQLASIAIQPPRDLAVSVWDKNAAGAVAKGIEMAKAGFSVSNDGSAIRVSLPALTDERRAELSKLVKKMTEETRISLRGARDEANKKARAAEEAKTMNEDQVFKTKEQVQKAVDQANKTVEAQLDKKLKEVAE